MARNQRQWLFVAPTLLIVGGGGWKLLNPSPTRAQSRIAHESLTELEGRLGYHLYAPTWLPANGRPGSGTKKGQFRILQDFSDAEDRSLLILAQERRNPERDRYHKKRFEEVAEAKADVNGIPAFFVTGTSGERRLFWRTKEMALIVSSTVLNDSDLLKVARSVR